MKNLRLILPSLALAALTSTGCWLVSGQFIVPVELTSPLTVASATTIAAAQVDLNTNGDYKDHKADLKGLADLALLGIFTNTGAGALDVIVYMTPATTTYTTAAQLTADGTKIKVWGPFTLGVGASKKIGWDESAALFGAAGKAAVLSEVKGDGIFTLYAVGASAPYAFKLEKGVAVVVIDAGK
jgi:hypothetical protein